MRGPDLKKLVRSLRTKSYEKLSIRRYLVALERGQAGQTGVISSQEEPNSGSKSHGEVNDHQESVRDIGRPPSR